LAEIVPNLPTIKLKLDAKFTLFNLSYPNILLHLIESAQNRIDFTAYVFSFFFYRKWHPSSRIFYALQAAAHRGVKIRCLLDSSKRNRPNHRANFFAYKRLRDIGISVRMPDTPLPQHSKLFLIPPAHCLIGSHNISDSSFRNPFEISILFESPSLYSALTKWYDDVWTHFATSWRRR